jgi:hypothetical protein
MKRKTVKTTVPDSPRVCAARATLNMLVQEIAERSAWVITLKMIRDLDVRPGIDKCQAQLAKLKGTNSEPEAYTLRNQLAEFEGALDIIENGIYGEEPASRIRELLAAAGVKPAPNQTDLVRGRMWLKRTERRLVELEAERRELMATIQREGGQYLAQSA